VINFENLAWLFSDPAHFDSFDGLVIDESTKLKAGGKAFKAIRRHIGQFSTRLCLTGTPVEEDFTGLFYQAMLVDHGAAYGKNKSAWLEKYFVQADYRGYQHSLIAADTLLAPFQDNIISLPSYSAELPALTETIVLIPGCRTTEYDELRRDMATGEVSAANAAVLTNKLQQAACGFLYSDSGETLHIHQHKIDWLTAQPRPAWRVIAYQYKEELTRLAAAFPDAYVIDQLAEWRTKGGDLLIHPRSAGHGLDLTAASTLVFMSPVWSRDLTRQTIARIWRRGQAADCSVDILVGEGTIEQDIVTRERGKASYHALLLANLAV
jgi:superfamily II DNA or RNA helicase